MPTPAAAAARRSRISARLEERDDYGVVLLLILATIVMVSVGFGSVGEFLSVCLSGFTLLFVLHTSDARQRTFRLSAVIVAIAVAAAAVGFLSDETEGSVAAGLIGLLLAFAAPVIILLRIFHSPRITVRLVLGALAIYLLLGLTYAYLYPVIGVLTGQPFFVQTDKAGSIDFVYFSYVTLTTVGYGDFTAATSAGRIFAVSEALIGQLYLVSAVALLVGNIGQTISRGDAPGDISIARSQVDEATSDAVDAADPADAS